jgi:hypothetical protein
MSASNSLKKENQHKNQYKKENHELPAGSADPDR